MGKLVLLSFAVGALFILSSYADAARQHEKFSQGTYYDQTQLESEKPVEVETTTTNPEETIPTDQKDKQPTELPQPDPVSTTIPDRYPNGYPGQEQYNSPLPGDQANSQSQFQGYKGGAQYSAKPTDDDSASKETVYDRYPRGYYPQDSPVSNNNEVDPQGQYQDSRYTSYSETTQTKEDQPKEDFSNRYVNGYYGKANLEARTQGENDPYRSYSTEVRFNTDDKQGVNFNTEPASEDPSNRYPNGYYQFRSGNSDDATNEPKVSNYNQQNQYQQDQSRQGQYQQNQFHYSQFPENQPKYGYENMQGDFSATLQGSEVPFELTGGACPSEYWVSKPQSWPKFFNMHSTVVDAFGEKAKPVYGEITIMDALTDTRSEPYSKLVHNACTAILNSYSRAHYKLKHTQVIESFNSALASPEAAKQQADLFQEANVSILFAFVFVVLLSLLA
ncbi:hypothetical protein R1sor_002190 [Riccia sorocarpa]|uniref:Uncharacterized protein n=1 Tax=Riccia sorocarpa TaxID=122646 RepID=A0ABD3GY31_9MARC